MTADVNTPTSEAATQSFEADVSRLLHLMVHSVYSDREIFVRELVSNAADACEKLRYEALAKPELIEDGAPFAIEIAINPDAKTLTFSDNGVGMTREDLTQGLGTIARSGTKAFLDKLAAEDASKEAAALIGQFGIGFYSAFMVADEVVVDTRRAGSSEAWRWSSDGKGSFTIAPLALENAPKRGTRVTLHLNDGSHEFAEPRRLERIVRDHSGAVAVPIDLIEKLGAEKRRIADGAAIWAKPKSDVTAEEYTEFYRGLSGQFDEPALTLHWRAEGRHEYTVLAFVPGSRPFDLFDPARKGRNKLYVRRVLITEDADLLPGWLRFVRLVVDSADLPLNVSRELIQKSDVFAAIRKGVTNRVVQELGKLAESEPEKFAKVWEHFGPVIKEGLYEDPERRDGLFKIARFTSTTHPAGDRTLAQYVASLRENQTAIFYLTGDDAKRLAASPQLEGFRARGVEVLAARRSGRRLLGVDRGGLRGQAVQVGEPGRRRHQVDRAGRGRERPGRGDRRGRDAVRLLQADAGGRGRRSARLRPPDRQRRLPDRARIRPRPPAREDARRAWPDRRADEADPRGQPHARADQGARRALQGGQGQAADRGRGLARARRSAAHGGRERRGPAGLRRAAAAGDGEGAGRLVARGR